ncbi:MAG: nucleoside triphosphate pyrophosphohydrolase [Dethiobacteria bacterium]|jgi:tetrapyrrole methylase family protein/MazG family protein
MAILYVTGLGRGDPASLQILEEGKYSKVRTCIFHSAPPALKNYLQQRSYVVIELEKALKKEPEEALKDLNGKTAELILDILENEKEVFLFLPGRPWSGEALLKKLRPRIDHKKNSLVIINGEEIWGYLMEYAGKRSEESKSARGIMLLDAHFLGELRDPPRCDLIILHPCSKQLISRIREHLLEFYPPDHIVSILQFKAGGDLFLYRTCPLAKIEEAGVFHCWTFFHLEPSPLYTLGDMASLMEQLRLPQGCPWDRQQDHNSLRPYLLEEAFEVLDAINNGGAAELCEELGDLLLQIVFHSRLASEKKEFTLWQVVDGIARKIYRRHPHVFQNERVSSARDVRLKWQEIKKLEKGNKGDGFTITPGLPALMKAQKVQKRAADLGFDWPDIQGAVNKLVEEVQELGDAYTAGNREKIEEELGDLFFSLVNVARFLKIDAEIALNLTVNKFIRRFRYIEKQAKLHGGDCRGYSLEELDQWWEEAKTLEKEEKS